MSRIIVNRVNKQILAKSGFNLSRNNTSVLQWFHGLPDKNRRKFLIFYVVSYYPSISEKLLTEAITFAKQYCEVSDSEIDIIMKARESFLIYRRDNQQQIYVKKDQNNNQNFDVPQGSFDSAEICELCGLYFLSQVTKLVKPQECGLYRNDGLMCLKNWPADG